MKLLVKENMLWIFMALPKFQEKHQIAIIKKTDLALPSIGSWFPIGFKTEND